MPPSHRIPLPTALACLFAIAAPAAASWDSSMGNLVAPANAARMPQLAVSDGAGGAFVVLGGATGAAQVGLFVQHLMADGTRAPGWPGAGAEAVSLALGGDPDCIPYPLDQVSATADGAGGVYVSWAAPPLEASSGAPGLYVQHLDASGARVAGWPAEGLSVTTGAGQASSTIYPDGGSGVFAIWRDVRHLFPSGSTGDDPHIILQHLLANGTRAPGFLPIGRFIGANMPPVREPRLSASFTAEPTGGAWAIVERASADTTVDPAGFIVMRTDLTGLMANGWGEDGIMLPGPSADIGHPGTHGARLFPDGSGGAWVFVASGA